MILTSMSDIYGVPGEGGLLSGRAADVLAFRGRGRRPAPFGATDPGELAPRVVVQSTVSTGTATGSRAARAWVPTPIHPHQVHPGGGAGILRGCPPQGSAEP